MAKKTPPAVVAGKDIVPGQFYEVVLQRAVTHGPHIYRSRIPLKMTGAFLLKLRDLEGDNIDVSSKVLRPLEIDGDVDVTSN